MSQELVTQDKQPGAQPPALFHRNTALSTTANAGAVAIEQERAIAEVQGQLVLAKRFPRDLNAAYAELMESCSLTAMAEQAFYSKPRGGKQITGPSIRLAEEIARVFGNFEFGHRELSRGDGKSEVEVYAWDKQTNNRSIRQITVMHTIDTKDGPRKLRDQSDIDDKIANVASKQARGRILAMMPKWLVQSAIDKCKETLAGGSSEPISVRVRKMTQAFAKYGVTTTHLETYLEHKLDDTTLDELVDLTGIFNAIKDGAKPSEFFGGKEAEAEASATTASKLAETAKAGATTTRQRRAPAAAAQQQVDSQQKDNAQSTQPATESNPAENQSTSTEEQASTVTNSAEASSSDSPRSDDPLF